MILVFLMDVDVGDVDDVDGGVDDCCYCRASGRYRQDDMHGLVRLATN